MKKLELPMLSLGMFFLGMGGQFIAYGENRFHRPIGLAVISAGAALMFFSFEENRNPYRLVRMAKRLKGYLTG